MAARGWSARAWRYFWGGALDSASASRGLFPITLANRTQQKAAQCAAFDLVGPAGLEPATKGL